MSLLRNTFEKNHGINAILQLPLQHPAALLELSKQLQLKIQGIEISMLHHTAFL